MGEPKTHALYRHLRSDLAAGAWLPGDRLSGNGSAQCKVGYIYRRGHGVPQDYAKAKEWQEKALKANDKDEGVLLEHYGDILFKLGDAAGALEQWKKAQAAGGASDLIDRKVSEGTLVE